MSKELKEEDIVRYLTYPNNLGNVPQAETISTTAHRRTNGNENDKKL